MLIDTHCHLDAAEFDGDREAVLAGARRAGVAAFVVPAVERAGFARIDALRRAHETWLAPGNFDAGGVQRVALGALTAGLRVSDDPALRP